MGGAIRHHGIAVADAAGDVAIAGQRGGGLLWTECVERGLILVAGHGADLIGRTGLPHPPDLQAGLAPWSGRPGFAPGAHRALRALQSLRSRNADLAAKAGRSLRSRNAGLAVKACRSLQSRNAGLATKAGKSLQSRNAGLATKAGRSLRSRNAGLAAKAGRSLWSRNAGLAAKAGWALWSCNAGLTAGAGRSLRPGRSLEPLWSGGARRSRPAACAGFAMKPGFVMAVLRVLAG
jgi:hypothetical protein